MAYVPVANINFQYDRNLNDYLKFYIPNTTTPISMATDETGATLLAKSQIDNTGFPTTDGTTLFIPFLDRSYDGWLFPSAVDADANDTSNALRVAQNINPFNDEFGAARNVVTAVTGQTVYPLAFNVSGEAVVIVNGSVLTETVDYSLSPNGTFYDLTFINPVFTGEIIQVWSRIMAPATAAVNSDNLAIQFIADIATTDLSSIDNFVTQNYDVVGDNGGAEWSFTGNTVPAKAGNPPALATGNVYDLAGREYVHSDTVIKDRTWGIKSSDDSLNIHIDVTTELDNFIAFGRLRAAQDGLSKGGSNLFFTPRQELEKTGTLNLIDYYIHIDFNNTRIIQQDSTNDVINYETERAGFSNLDIRWNSSITAEDFYNGQPAGVRFSGGQVISPTSQSPFLNVSQVWITGGYDGFRLNSVSPAGGLIWQSIFQQCLVQDHMNNAFDFVSIAQTSTTTEFSLCHVGATTRDGVLNAGQSYLALQHMEAASPVEPGVTVGWEAYWELEAILVPTRSQWLTGTFYRTMGKGWFINDIQTCSLPGCSMDGGHNAQEGNVINSFNSIISIPDFHLEVHNMSQADGISMLLGSDADIGSIFLVDTRIRCGTGNVTYVVGGVTPRNRNMHIESVRNKFPNVTSGELKYVDGGFDITAFNAITCGAGVPAHLTANMPDETHYDRPVKVVEVTTTGVLGTRIYINGTKSIVVGGGSSPVYTIEREDSGAFIQTDATGVFTVTADNTITPEGDAFNLLNRGSGSTTLVAGGTSTILGSLAAPSEKTLTVTRISNTIFFSKAST